MVVKRPKIVIIGAGMAGITAANKLYTTPGVKESFNLCIVEGSNRIGGRINTRHFCGDKIEMGATWIHGIGGSPIYDIAKKIKSLECNDPFECMGGLHEDRLAMSQTRIEGGFGFVVDATIVDPITSVCDELMSFCQGKSEKRDTSVSEISSIGSFLKVGVENYIGFNEINDGGKVYGDWSKKMLEKAIFDVYQNTLRTFTAASDLFTLDYAAESEYRMFPGDEITIPGGYLSVIDALASVLPSGFIQLGKKVEKIEWSSSSSSSNRPVKLHFSDGEIMQADHVIVTVSLGVLKSGIVSDENGEGLFSPSLPNSKKEAISRLGYGVVNKLFLELRSPNELPFMQMAFHRVDSKFKDSNIPWWMRKTASIYPIYDNSSVFLSWFAGKEALELESLDDEAIIIGVSKTVSSFVSENSSVEFSKVLRSKWGSDPLFLGSYSYVTVGSSGDDFDTLAEPLPLSSSEECGLLPLQILFAGEATHRTHYSTTHGAYYSGLREANRLLHHYKLIDA